MGVLINSLIGKLRRATNDIDGVRYSQDYLNDVINYAIQKIYSDYLKNGILLESFKVKYQISLNGNSSLSLPQDFAKPLEVYRVIDNKRVPIDWGLFGEVSRPNVYIFFDIQNRMIFNTSNAQVLLDLIYYSTPPYYLWNGDLDPPLDFARTFENDIINYALEFIHKAEVSAI